jgi:hypothetical protein
MSDTPDNYVWAMPTDFPVIIWWALYEKEQQLRTRYEQYKHMDWPDEAKNAAFWEANKLAEIRASLDKLAPRK